eukprot:6201395-Pleurochrysis_carterae.AAC.1
MSSQLPLAAWFEISARSAAVHPSRSSRSACLRVLGSPAEEDASMAHAVEAGVLQLSRTVSRAEGARSAASVALVVGSDGASASA